MRKFLILFFFIPFTFIHAAYVLPYPGPMPGNKIYKVSRIIDKLQYYWHWGPLVRSRYYMNLSDKYLVEAKILFEYKQYLLGVDALKRSDETWSHIQSNISAAQKNNEDAVYILNDYKEESLTHIQILHNVLTEIPETFTWTPEKTEATELHLKNLIEDSIKMRQQ